MAEIIAGVAGVLMPCDLQVDLQPVAGGIESPRIGPVRPMRGIDRDCLDGAIERNVQKIMGRPSAGVGIVCDAVDAGGAFRDEAASDCACSRLMPKEAAAER